ncbi:MAG: Ig-like domain-containing protein [Pirellulaceae bacterium]
MGAIRTGRRAGRARRGPGPNRRLGRSQAGYRPQLEQLEPRVLLALNPTGIEQEVFQLVNRFRADPQGELTRLVSNLDPPNSTDPYVSQQLKYWEVNGKVLASQFRDLVSVPPLAWSEALYDSAHDHNLAMLVHDGQLHQFPGEPDPGTRMRNSGYNWQRWGENIYAYPRSTIETHAGFVIDWGDGPNGIQDPPDHRIRLLNGKLVHIGVAIDNVGYDSGRRVGPWLVTQDLAAPLTTTAAYVVGAVYTEKNGSPWYVAGSGYGNVEVIFEGSTGTFRTTSWSAGGYQIQLPPGVYRGRASGSNLPVTLGSDEVVVGLSNVAVDFVNPVNRILAPQAMDDAFVMDTNMTGIFDILQNDWDPDGQLMPSTLSIVSGPTAGQIDVDSSTGQVTYNPARNFAGLDKFIYQVRDDDGLWSSRVTARIIVGDFQNQPWHNPENALDVNIDEQVSPIDALQIINALNTRGSGNLPVPPASDNRPPPLLDVTGDNRLSPLDALRVINHLNADDVGEGEFFSMALVSPSASQGGMDADNRSGADDRLPPIEEFLTTQSFDTRFFRPAAARRMSPFRGLHAGPIVPDPWKAGEALIGAAEKSGRAATGGPTHFPRQRRGWLEWEATVDEEVFRDWPPQLLELQLLRF